MSDPPFALEHSTETVAIVGVGLIGGSIAAALKARGFRGPVIGVGRDAGRLEQACSAGLIDEGFTDLASAARRSDWIIVCTPVDCIATHVREAAPHCRPGTLVTDAGSVKQSICRALDRALPPGVMFIGSHPLAGSEKQGFEHARSNLFEGRVCVVTPDASTSEDQLARVTGFWRSLGLEVLQLSADDHDRAVARTSHLPHVVAASLASALADGDAPLAATGFRDTTRIAAGDPDLWTAILLNNTEALLTALDAFSDRLANLRGAIEARDRTRIRELLAYAKHQRDALNNGNEDRDDH